MNCSRVKYWIYQSLVCVPHKCTSIPHSPSSKRFIIFILFWSSRHPSWSLYFLWFYCVICNFSSVWIIYFWLYSFRVFQSVITLHNYIFFWSLLFIVIIWYFYHVVFIYFIYFSFQNVTSVSSVLSSILSLENITSWFICFF